MRMIVFAMSSLRVVCRSLRMRSVSELTCMFAHNGQEIVSLDAII